MLELDKIWLRHGSHDAIRNLSLHMEQGQIACLLGPSGSGKTTLLRAIAGLHPLSGGQIQLQGKRISAPAYTLDPVHRGIGLVFQDLALMPHLTVAKNIAFGLHKKRSAEQSRRVDELLELTDLQGLGPRFPHELSGGQCQRVALARALAPQPQLLLLDEPFSSLDQSLRLAMAERIGDIVSRAQVTTLVVTHDQHEAFALGQQVGLIAEGELQQWDTPYNLYHRPANRLVADFIGDGVFLPAQIDSEGFAESELGRLGRPNNGQFSSGDVVDVLLRPDDVVHDDASSQTANVVSKAFRGAEILYQLALPSGQRIKALVPSHHNHALGEAIGYRLELDHLVAFARSD